MKGLKKIKDNLEDYLSFCFLRTKIGVNFPGFEKARNMNSLPGQKKPPRVSQGRHSTSCDFRGCAKKFANLRTKDYASNAWCASFYDNI